MGKEYNLDILNDFHGNYLDSCAKIKLSMRAGETDKAKIVNNPKLILIAKKISKDLRHIGNLDCDLIIDKKGKVRKIHTGFNGPATGDKYTEFKEEFEGFVSELLNQ